MMGAKDVQGLAIKIDVRIRGARPRAEIQPVGKCQGRQRRFLRLNMARPSHPPGKGGDRVMTRQLAPDWSLWPSHHGDSGALTPSNGIPTIDILSPDCVRAEFQKIWISRFRRLDTPRDRQLTALVNDLKPLVQQQFEITVVVSDEEPSDARIQRGIRQRQIPVHDGAVEPPPRRERRRHDMIRDHAVFGPELTHPAPGLVRFAAFNLNRNSIQPCEHRTHADDSRRPHNRPDEHV